MCSGVVDLVSASVIRRIEVHRLVEKLIKKDSMKRGPRFNIERLQDFLN